jgi:hypothetical protein
MDTIPVKVPFVTEITAFKCPGIPVNPLPFLNALAGSIRTNGTDWIKTDEAKAIMHTLNQMVYGQLYKLNSIKEFERLSSIFKDMD